MVWKPNLTVAAIIEKDGQFLFVEERSGSKIVINQPAGHVEPGESLIQAVIRETLEETGYYFMPEALVGIYYWHAHSNGITYLRFAFTGQITRYESDRPLDGDILQITWLSRDMLLREVPRHRSPSVILCLDDYLAGKRYPLEVITTLSL